MLEHRFSPTIETRSIRSIGEKVRAERESRRRRDRRRAHARQHPAPGGLSYPLPLPHRGALLPSSQPLVFLSYPPLPPCSHVEARYVLAWAGAIDVLACPRCAAHLRRESASWWDRRGVGCAIWHGCASHVRGGLSARCGFCLGHSTLTLVPCAFALPVHASYRTFHATRLDLLYNRAWWCLGQQVPDHPLPPRWRGH